MAKTKVIALDIYGTVLCLNDEENAMPPKNGFKEFIDQARSLNIRIVTSSDADIANLKLDLAESFCGRIDFSWQVFDGFYQLAMRPKHYEQILSDFGIIAEELLIIGDNLENDFLGAPDKASTNLVPAYEAVNDDFDFRTIIVP